MFKPSKGHLQAVYLIHNLTCKYVLCDLQKFTSGGSFFELAAITHKTHSLKMNHYGFKHVGVTYSLNKVVA